MLKTVSTCAKRVNYGVFMSIQYLKNFFNTDYLVSELYSLKNFPVRYLAISHLLRADDQLRDVANLGRLCLSFSGNSLLNEEIHLLNMTKLIREITIIVLFLQIYMAQYF